MEEVGIAPTYPGDFSFPSVHLVSPLSQFFSNSILFNTTFNAMCHIFNDWTMSTFRARTFRPKSYPTDLEPLIVRLIVISSINLAESRVFETQSLPINSLSRRFPIQNGFTFQSNFLKRSILAINPLILGIIVKHIFLF